MFITKLILLSVNKSIMLGLPSWALFTPLAFILLFERNCKVPVVAKILIPNSSIILQISNNFCFYLFL